MRSLNENAVDDRSSVPARGVRAMEISELQDLIEVEIEAARRMRWLGLPLGLLLFLFFLSMAVTYGGPPAIILSILFFLALAKRIQTYRRSADHLSSLEERLSELVEDGGMRPGV